MSGWLGVDLDGTLAQYEKFVAPDNIGEPIPLMVERVKKWLSQGRQVKIFTARVYPYAIDKQQRAEGCKEQVYCRQWVDSYKAYHAIQEWCEKHLGQTLEITCVKDYHMYLLYDDRAKQVIPNTGELVEEQLDKCRREQLNVRAYEVV